ncbi:MAG: hypothetical protein U1A25_01405 [Candidatus Sungbacteria bacterium]|nr:hypothetical protein [Candidatus Sungbacteria bacterium]
MATVNLDTYAVRSILSNIATIGTQKIDISTATATTLGIFSPF